jgi:hypothetical protein
MSAIEEERVNCSAISPVINIAPRKLAGVEAGAPNKSQHRVLGSYRLKEAISSLTGDGIVAHS